MRVVEWTDRDGYRRRSLVRDADPDSAAPAGIPQESPDLGQLDWEAIKRDIHNTLMDQGLYTWEDVVRQQSGVTHAITSVIRRHVIVLFRQQ